MKKTKKQFVTGDIRRVPGEVLVHVVGGTKDAGGGAITYLDQTRKNVG